MDIFVFILLILLGILIFAMIISAVTYGLSSGEKVSIVTFSLLMIIFLSVNAFINYKYQNMLNQKLDSISQRVIANNNFIAMTTEKLDICNELLDHQVETHKYRK